jgi:hypothetical protein
MTARAIGFIPYVECLLAIMTLPTEITLRDLVHLHFVGSLCHLKNPIMAICAFEILPNDMFFMAENDWKCIFGRKCQITAAYLLCRNGEGNKAGNTYKHACYYLHVSSYKICVAVIYGSY